MIVSSPRFDKCSNAQMQFLVVRMHLTFQRYIVRSTFGSYAHFLHDIGKSSKYLIGKLQHCIKTYAY
jgi:hypothetical protein